MADTLVLGETNFWSPVLKEDLARYGVGLIAPQPAKKSAFPIPGRGWLAAVRRRVETVTSQLVGRYHIKRARDL